MRNGDWFLSEGPDWAVSTWVQDVRFASRFRSGATARGVASEARENGCRPFAGKPEDTKAARVDCDGEPKR